MGIKTYKCILHFEFLSTIQCVISWVLTLFKVNELIEYYNDKEYANSLRVLDLEMFSTIFFVGGIIYLLDVKNTMKTK